MIEVNNLTGVEVDKKFFLGIAKKVLKGENREMGNLSVAFVDKKEIRKLNKNYRKINKPTDVLSFGGSLGFKGEFCEVVICPEVVEENTRLEPHALNGKNVLKKELAKVLIHGILHILGYDHEKSEREVLIMEEKQNHYLTQAF